MRFPKTINPLAPVKRDPRIAAVEEVVDKYFVEIWKQRILEGTPVDETARGGPKKSEGGTPTPPGREWSSWGEGKQANTHEDIMPSLDRDAI